MVSNRELHHEVFCAEKISFDTSRKKSFQLAQLRADLGSFVSFISLNLSLPAQLPCLTGSSFFLSSFQSTKQKKDQG